MFKKLFEDIKKSLEYVDEHQVKFIKDLRGLINTDIANLGEIFGKSKSNVFYHAPDAEKQLDAKTRMLDEYKKKVTTTLAALLYIHSNPNTDKTNKIKEIKTIAELSGNKQVISHIKEIKQIEKDKKELKKTVETIKESENPNTNYINRLKGEKEKLESKINSHETKIKKTPGGISLSSNLKQIHRKIVSHNTIKKNLPKGMLDVKRALFLLGDIKKTEKK